MIHIRMMIVICMNLLLHHALGLGGGGVGRVFDEESRWGFFGTELKLKKRFQKAFRLKLFHIRLILHSKGLTEE